VKTLGFPSTDQPNAKLCCRPVLCHLQIPISLTRKSLLDDSYCKEKGRMKSESDAKTSGRRILRVVVVASDKDIDGLSVEDEDGNPLFK
jgi:hypothetical protein